MDSFQLLFYYSLPMSIKRKRTFIVTNQEAVSLLKKCFSVLKRFPSSCIYTLVLAQGFYLQRKACLLQRLQTAELADKLGNPLSLQM